MTEPPNTPPRTEAEINEELSLRPPAPRVVRLSRKALIALGAASSIALSAALFWALRSPGPIGPPPELINTEGRQPTEALATLPKDYTAIPKLGPPLPGDLGRPMLAAGVQPPDARAAASPGQPASPDPAAEARLRRIQLADAARVSRLFAADARGPALEAGTLASGTPASETPAPADPAKEDPGLQIGPAQDLPAPSQIVTPAAPYMLQAGSIISAALITGLRSDLPGQVTAQVTEPVYGGPFGRTVLIPQGARLIGEYESGLRFGNRRALLAWTRLVLPDGRSLALEREPAADAGGYAGLEDKVDNHWGQIFKAALVSTVLSIGSEAGTSNEEAALVRALRRGSSDSIAQAGQQIVGRSLTVAPTLTIRPGFPVRVIVTRDLTLEPWRGAE